MLRMKIIHTKLRAKILPCVVKTAAEVLWKTYVMRI